MASPSEITAALKKAQNGSLTFRNASDSERRALIEAGLGIYEEFGGDISHRAGEILRANGGRHRSATEYEMDMEFGGGY